VIPKTLYLLVVERDTYEPAAEDRPIVFEQYVDGEHASLEAIEKRKLALGNLYGKSYIYKAELFKE